MPDHRHQLGTQSSNSNDATEQRGDDATPSSQDFPGVKKMASHIRGSVALAAIGAGLAPAAVVAQENSEAVTEVSVDLVGRYDSNIARSSEARALSRGLERSDYVVSPTLSFNLVRPWGAENNVRVKATLGYNFHGRNSQLDRERIAVDSGLRVGVGPCRLDTGASVRRQQSDLADIAFLSNVPLAEVRNTETAQSYNAFVSCGEAVGLRPGAGIDYSTGRNTAAVRDRAEFDAVRYTTSLDYVSPTLGTIGLFASRRDVDLVSQRVNGRVDGYRVTQYGVRFSRDLGTRVQLSRNALVRGNSSFVWNADLTALLGSRLQATFGTGREVSNSLASDAAYVIARPYSARFTYAVNDRMQVEAGGSITARRYAYAFVPATDVITNETRRIYDVGVSYNVGRNLRLRAAVGRDERNANGTVFDYKGTFATASIGLRF
jgi:hypothetical protein